MAAPMTTVTPEGVASKARELASSDADGAVDALIGDAGDDRALLEAARDQVAARIRAAVDDFEATAALTLLNRALSELPRHDPLDWRVRWTRRFRKP